MATKSTSTAEVSSVGVTVEASTQASSSTPLPPSPASSSAASTPHSSLAENPAPGTSTALPTKPTSSIDPSKVKVHLSTCPLYRDANTKILECPVCVAEYPEQCFPKLSTCEHRSCYDCFQIYLRVEISESRTQIACPECTERLHPNDVRMILNDPDVYEKYEDFMVRRVLAVDPDTRWCPQPDCGFAVIASGCASCPKLKCLRPGCPGVFCYHCKADWHPNQTCDAAREQRRGEPGSSGVGGGISSAGASGSSKSSSSSPLSRDAGIKPCPRCSVLIVKMDDGSCNHMTCAVCGAEFCWLCMKEVGDLHYLSPSGCTFWGKKPWSRKKKILWQLGTLVGAPVGIALVAGIALPAMVIGIPVWVGRKVYRRYRFMNKHKRNLLIATAVTGTIMVSPIIAGLVVSIGVPILLFYVYGVVPVSLCRSGGCDVSTSGSGFHFDFDDNSSDGEEDELEGGGAEGGEGESSSRYKDKGPNNRRMRVVATELGLRLGYRGGNIADAVPSDNTSHKGTNPSIGEASLSMDSGSHVERDDEDEEDDLEVEGEEVARLHPGSSSTRHVACDECGGLKRVSRGRMEVQAEVQQPSQQSQHRLSLCSEDTIDSGNTADDGAASTRALAGSVLSYKVSADTTSGRQVPGPDFAEAGCSSAEVPLASTSSAGAEHRSNKSQDDSSNTSECVRFDDNISIYIAEHNSPEPIPPQSHSPGRRSPSSFREALSMGRALRHILLSSSSSADKLQRDVEAQN